MIVYHLFSRPPSLSFLFFSPLFSFLLFSQPPHSSHLADLHLLSRNWLLSRIRQGKLRHGCVGTCSTEEAVSRTTGPPSLSSFSLPPSKEPPSGRGLWRCSEHDMPTALTMTMTMMVGLCGSRNQGRNRDRISRKLSYSTVQ
jgi:hypothetical protein